MCVAAKACRPDGAGPEACLWGIHHTYHVTEGLSAGLVDEYSGE